MKKLSASEILNYIIELFLYYLENFKEEPVPEQEEFVSGERVAYVECLEIIQHWEHAKANGLDFDIEAKYPL